MLPINLLLAKHRHPTTYKLMQGFKLILKGLGNIGFIIILIVAIPLLFPFWLLDEVETKLTRCHNCGCFGGLRKYKPEKYGATFYLCIRCKARYMNYRNTWKEASAPEYDHYFGKNRDVRSLLRAATRPDKSGAELIRPLLSITVETQPEQLARPAGKPE